MPLVLTDQRKVHSFELAKQILLDRSTVVPGVCRGAKPVDGCSKAVRIGDELILMHKPAADFIQGGFVVPEQSAS